MREIKFRSWVENENYSYMVNSPDFVGEINNIFAQNGIENELGNKITYMQYTGLKDKNGREIYEGDILKGVSNQHTTVIFDEGCYGVSPLMRVSFHNDVKKPLFMTLRSTDIHEIEVIGNIYENPELLKGDS